MTMQAISFEPSQARERVDMVPGADILLVVGNFADERAVAPRLVAWNWRYRAFVRASVEEVLASLGELREKLIGPAQWVAQTSLGLDEGPDAQWFVTRYRQEDGFVSCQFCHFSCA